MPPSTDLEKPAPLTARLYHHPLDDADVLLPGLRQLPPAVRQAQATARADSRIAPGHFICVIDGGRDATED